MVFIVNLFLILLLVLESLNDETIQPTLQLRNKYGKIIYFNCYVRCFGGLTSLLNHRNDLGFEKQKLFLGENCLCNEMYI